MSKKDKSQVLRWVIMPLAEAVLFSLGTTTMAQWKWIDSQGRTQYTQTPPPSSVPPQNILARPSEAPKPIPPVSGSPVQNDASDEQDKQTRELEQRMREQESREAEKKARQEEAAAQLKAEACEDAKRNLEMYSSGFRIRDMNDKGEYVYQDEQQLQARRSAAQQQVDKACN